MHFCVHFRGSASNSFGTQSNAISARSLAELYRVFRACYNLATCSQVFSSQLLILRSDKISRREVPHK
jgi:hypothetical protein